MTDAATPSDTPSAGSSATPWADAIRARLEAALAPERLEITDDSHRHRGHAGWNPKGESHFRLLVVASAFEGMSRIARHRHIHGILARELSAHIHALTISALTPAEYDAGKSG